MSACKRVVCCTDVRDVVLYCLVIQFCTMTLSTGLAYRQTAHVVCLSMRVIILFGYCLAGLNFLLALLSLRVCTLHQGF